MTVALLEALIDKKAFTDETIITAWYSTIDLFGRSFRKSSEFKIHKIVKDNGDHTVFELIALQDSRIIKTSADEIRAIDGMDLSRYADIYDLHPDGTSKKIGKKRGRKPKSYIN